MKNNTLKLMAALIAAHFSYQISAQVMTKNAPTYPTTRQDPSVLDDYHGIKVTDPYRWLEDDNAAETKDWVKKQNELTFGYLEKIPFREAVKAKLTTFWDYEKFGSPFKEGGKYYFYRNSGLQNQSVLYVQNDLESTPSVFLDPNDLSKEGTVALGAMSFNKAGNLAAYQLSKAGSDWQTIYVKDAVTGKTLEDKVEWVKFSGIAWAGDGFFYSRYPEPKKGEELKGASEFQAVYFHKIGTPQSADALIYEDKTNAKRGFSSGVTDDERFLQVAPWEGTSGNMLIVKDLKNDGKFVTIVDDFKNDWNVIDNDGDWLLVQTNYKAPNGRVVAINPTLPDEKNWKEIIPENKSDVLQGCSMIGGKLAVNYLHDVSSSIKFYDPSGKFQSELKLPGIGTVGGLSGKRRKKRHFIRFQVSRAQRQFTN